MEDDDGIENMIRKYLRGEAPNVSHPQCDVIHKRDQLRDDEVAVLKYNVHYIVAAVLINEKGEVLMMQEAKVSCRGTWYLPAGRMERNETLEEGVKREVHEETGLEFQPSAIIFIECIHGNWVRVTFTGSVTGGILKTLEESDGESMQAAWVPILKGGKPDISPIRAFDILKLIEIGVEYNKYHNHPAILPVLNPYHNVCIRHLIFVKNRDALSTLLVNGHPPLVKINHGNASLITEVALGKSMTAMSMGILAVEHAGKPPKETDGLCFTQLSWMETDKQPSNAAYHLYEITDQSLRQQIIKMLEPGRTIPSNLH